MSEDKDSRTEDPTAKRLSKAREEGDIPVSQEVKSLAMLLGGLVVIGVLAPWVTQQLMSYMRTFIERPHVMDVRIETLRFMFFETVQEISIVLAFPMLVLAIAAVVSNLGQIGLVFTPKKLEPNLNAISPIAGFKRLFSTQSLVEAGKGVVKIGIVSVAVGLVVLPAIHSPDEMLQQDIRVTLKQIHWLIVLIFFLVVLVMAVLAAADLLYQRWQHNEKLKMTKQEVKDEHKEAEGDPKVKGKIRALRMERVRKRMMAAVPQASVVITNPTHFAVALKYDMERMAAPIVVAKGVDYLALRIRQIAGTHEVPVIENPPLARALYAAVEVDQEIPQEHYKAVAEVIGYVMRLKGKGGTRPH